MEGILSTARSVAVCVCMLFVGTGLVRAQEQPSAGDGRHPVDAYRQLLDRYCVTCHNRALRTAGLLLDQANVQAPASNPELWERVITKLSLRAMPPVGIPMRPDDSQYQGFLSYLQASLDAAARDNLNPGSPPIHRLNRTEYANAIRHILDMEIDAAALLPPDNVSEGFDNIAEVLAVSPLLMERYMFAAGRISRLAIGPPAMQPASETYHVSPDFLQRERMSEDLPFGSRGGTTVRHRFPLDGEYTINVTLQKNLEGYIRGMQEEHTLDIRLDHDRLAMLTVGGEVHGRSGPVFTGNQNPLYSGDKQQVGYEFTADNKLAIRFPAKAGTHLVGVTFIDEKTKPGGILQPELTLADIQAYKGGLPAVESVTITGPFRSRGPGQTASRGKIFVCQPGPAATQREETACAETILTSLARRAYRRPVTSEDMEPLMQLFQQGLEARDFEKGIELSLQSILAGPEFLFRIEQAPPQVSSGEVYRISDIDLASRLSFFLWSTVPDEELLGLAGQGRLSEPAVLRRQVRRMIADDRFDAFITNFGGQWLSVRGIDIATPNPEIFPDFDDELRESFKQELRLWFESMVREDRSVAELLTSGYTYVNERLARHYGMPDVSGSRYRRVSVNRAERNGVMGKGGLLLATAYNNRTSPVLRGKWVLENLLDMPPPPPPEDVPALEVSDGGKALTLKQAMERHRANPVCASCHKLMDPIGFALENFDAIGKYRERYLEADAEVDASGILFDGSHFRNTREFQDEFMQHSERVVNTAVEKVLTYALGRGLEYYDQPAVRVIVDGMATGGYTWSSLILGVIESAPFQYRRAAAGQGVADHR